jgi:hypothetical protein
MNVLKSFFAAVFCGVFIVCLLTLQSGCEGQGGAATNQAKPKKPNLKFHRPKTLDEAVTRLSAIHDAVKGESELPAARTFDYVEVIHGQGASAHSHYYMADSYNSAMEHDEEEGHHDEEHETIERHTAEVDFRTEFADVVRWLPDIAAASDLSSTDWQSVSDVSKKVTKLLKSIPTDPSDSKLREAWMQNSDEINEMISGLQKMLVAKSGDGE